MSYNIEFKINCHNNLPAKTFREWLATIEYSYLDGLFPEIAEADWPSIRSQLLNIAASTNCALGVTPGLINYTEVITDSGATVNITFDNIDSFNLYAAHCAEARLNEFRFMPGVSFQKPLGQTLDPYPIRLEGRRKIIEAGFDNNFRIIEEPKIGSWIQSKYHIHYQTVTSCIHTET